MMVLGDAKTLVAMVQGAQGGLGALGLELVAVLA